MSTTSAPSCGTCGWWHHNPIAPERSLGLCTVETSGLVTDTIPTKRRNQKCKKWVSIALVEPVYSRFLIRNQSPDGCSTCPAKMAIYKSTSCRVSTFVNVSDFQTYRRCNLMTPAMCWYGRRVDALRKFGEVMT